MSFMFNIENKDMIAKFTYGWLATKVQNLSELVSYVMLY